MEWWPLEECVHESHPPSSGQQVMPLGYDSQYGTWDTTNPLPAASHKAQHPHQWWMKYDTCVCLLMQRDPAFEWHNDQYPTKHLQTSVPTSLQPGTAYVELCS